MRLDKIKSKLKAQGGESLSETLISTMIAGLALLALAQTLSVSAKLIEKSSYNMQNYISTENSLNDGSATKHYGSVEFKMNDNSVSYDSDVVYYATDEDNKEKNIVYYEKK